MKNILIIGATSSIAKHTARLYAKQNCSLYLIARDKEQLETIAADLKIKGAKAVNYDLFEANITTSYELLLNKAFESLGFIDLILIAHGTLPNQKHCQDNTIELTNALTVNAISVVVLLTHIANRLEKQQHGTIAVITSVAGIRGRQSNYIYGAAKGMISLFLQGLRNRLFKSNVNIIDIKPGLIDTPMTNSFKKGLLWSKPEKVANCIYKAVKKNKHTIYAPCYWKYIMIVIKLIPESLFKRLSL